MATAVVARTFGPKPSLDVVKFKEGIVEIGLRIACVVSAWSRSLPGGCMIKYLAMLQATWGGTIEL